MPRPSSQIVIAVAALATIAGAHSTAIAETTTLVADRDNTLYQSETGHLSNGAGDWFFAGKTFTSFTRRGLLHFNLDLIPADAVVTGATLTLSFSLGQPAVADVSLHRASASWGEGTSNPKGNEGGGADATPGDATWLHTHFDTALWTNAGGDFDPSASATTPVGPDFGLYTWSGEGLLADVQAWVNGTAANNGWVVIGDEVTRFATARRFGTRENPIESERPTLFVEWTVPARNPADLDGDGAVNAADLAILLGAWDQPGETDLDGDGTTGASDLAVLLGAWSV
jgi:hypothetical protein